MTNAARVLGLFKALGFDYNVSHFDDRLVGQKLVYILKELGVQLPYGYDFYVRGTYSPALTKELFKAHESSEHMASIEPTKLELAAVSRLREGVAELRPNILEVITAYRYLRNAGKTEMEALYEIKEKKPFIPERDVAVAISKSKGLWPEATEADRQDLAEEMGAWEQAAAEDAI